MTPSPPLSSLIPVCFSLSVLRPSSSYVIIPLRHFVKLPFELKCIDLRDALSSPQFFFIDIVVVFL